MSETEQIRHGILAALYPVRALRVPISYLTRLLKADGHQVDDKTVSQELRFLANLEKPLVNFETDDLGSSTYWQISTHGILRHERSA